MPKAVRVPAPFEPLFNLAEGFVEGLFAKLVRRPEQGTLHVGDDRYVLMRAESFYLAWSEALEASYGRDATRDLLYNTAREIGRADCKAFSKKLKVKDPEHVRVRGAAQQRQALDVAGLRVLRGILRRLVQRRLRPRGARQGDPLSGLRRRRLRIRHGHGGRPRRPRRPPPRAVSSKRPADVGVFAGRVLDVLERYTMFPWPLLKTQAERNGCDPLGLTPEDLPALLDDVEVALARFTSPEKATAAMNELRRL